MRILVVSKFGYLLGGLERVMFEEIDWLRRAGHDVEYFATADLRNLPSRFSDLFPAGHEYGPAGRAGAAAARDMFWNRDAAARVASVMAAFRPHVMHCHGIHRHLTPSVLFEAHRAGVPAVMTAHDFFLVCPGNVLLRGGAVPCDRRSCGQRTFLGAVPNRCVQGSAVRSALGAAELSYQRITRNYESMLRCVICPSQFMAKTLAAAGVKGPELVVLPNSVAEPEARLKKAKHGPFVVAGRVSAEKGVEVALQAARDAGVPISVAGEGPLSESLSDRFPEADFVGRLESPALADLVASSTAVVVPSLWFENAPMSVLEAMAAGVPVIASRIGGIPEQVHDGREGLLVQPGDVATLSSAMLRLWDDPALGESLGAAGRRTARERFSPRVHVEGLERIYLSVTGDR